MPQHSNVILLGGVGVGKTHLAVALAHAACLRGRTALFTSAVDIVNTLAAAQATGGIKREMARLMKPSLLVVDELDVYKRQAISRIPIIPKPWWRSAGMPAMRRCWGVFWR